MQDDKKVRFILISDLRDPPGCCEQRSKASPATPMRDFLAYRRLCAVLACSARL